MRLTATTALPSPVMSLALMAAVSAIAFAAISRSMPAALIAVAVVHLIVLFSPAGPGIGIMVLTTGRYLYFIALLVFLNMEGNSSYTAAYFFAIDVLAFVSLVRNAVRDTRPFSMAGSKILVVSVALFTLSTVVAWVYSGYDPDGLYWIGTYIVFALCPLLVTLAFTPRQVYTACRWIFWSVALLAAVFMLEIASGQVSWFYGRASLEISDVPQIGSLFIGSVIPIGLFALAFLGREFLPAIGIRSKSGALLVLWGFVAMLVTVLAFTGQRSPLVALIAAAIVCLLLVPRISVKQRLGIVACAVLLLVPFSVVPNAGRYRVLSQLVQGQSGALASDVTASMRLEYYRIALDSFLSAPMLGTGLGTFWTTASRLTAFPDRIPHNAFLEIAAGQGLLGVVPIGMLIVATAWTAFGDMRRFSDISDSRFRLLAFVFISWIYDMALIGTTGSVFADSTFWFFLGAIWVLHSSRGSLAADGRITPSFT